MATTDINTTTEKTFEDVLFVVRAKAIYNQNQLPLLNSIEMAVRRVGC
jgi:hypothetical protein